MKALRKLFYISCAAMLVLFVGLRVVFGLLDGKEVELINITIAGLAVSLGYSLVYYGLISVSFKPRYNYLESVELKEPDFKDKYEKMIETEHALFDFNEVKNKIQERWVITFFDSQNMILKYRSDIKFNSWGVGGFLKMGKDTIKIISFPILGYTRKGQRLSQEMITLTEKMIAK